MNWFVTLNEAAFRAERYVELFKVAVHTGQTKTSLVPHLLYDGSETAVVRWARRRGVRVLHVRSFLYDRLAAIAGERGDPNLLAIGAGTLLRIEIPALAPQLGIRDTFALYTDVDVMFTADPCPFLRTLSPALFAAAAEFDRKRPDLMNAGVMLMNLDGLRAVDAPFRAFVATHLASLVDENWDQGAYRRFFGRPRLPAKLLGPRWTSLPPECNWRPYWGDSFRASIVHFHGPKPHDRAALKAGRIPDDAQWMVPYATTEYERLAAVWQRTLDEIAE